VRRALAGGAVAGVLLGAASAPLMPRVALAALCSQPSVTSISVQAPGSGQSVPQQYGPAGSTVTLQGSGLQSFGCSTSVSIGGQQVSGPSVGSQQITFNVPSQSYSGQVAVSLTDTGGASNTDNHMVYVTNPSGNSLSNSTPYTGDTVYLQGNGFNFNLPSGWETLAAGYKWQAAGMSGSCPGTPAGGPGLADGSHITLPMPTQFCKGTATVALSAPCTSNGQACSGSSNTRMTFFLSAPFDINPRVSGMTGSGVAGSTETVSGSGFGGQGGTVTVNGTDSPVVSWSDTTVKFSVSPDATSGPVQLVRAVDGKNFSPSGTLGVVATVSGISPDHAAVGDAVTVSGAGFGTQTGAITVGSTTATVQTWSTTSIVFTVPAGATSGAVDVSPSGTSPPTGAPTLTVIAKITGITPSHATAGSLVEVDGTTFGTQQGTVQMGGQDAQVTLWGDRSVLVMVPQLSAGSVDVSLTPPGAQAAAAAFTVDPAPTSPPHATSSSSSGSSSSASATPGFIAPNPSGPIIAHGAVPFRKPPAPPGPVSLQLKSAAVHAAPGDTVDFTVTLTAFGRPMTGAPVDLVMVIEPGSDASIDPTHAVTDASGQVHGVLHLSRTAGDHIILARSGIYSDEIRVVGGTDQAITAGARAPGASARPSDTPPLLAVRSPVLWALASCLLLFGLGFGLNLVTAPAPAAGGAGVAGSARAGRGGVLASLRGGVAVLGDAARFAGGVVALFGAQAMGALRRGGR